MKSFDLGTYLCQDSIAYSRESATQATAALEELEDTLYTGGDPWDTWGLYKESVREIHRSLQGMSDTIRDCILTEQEVRDIKASQTTMTTELQTMLEECPHLVRELGLNLRLGGCEDLRDAWTWVEPAE